MCVASGRLPDRARRRRRLYRPQRPLGCAAVRRAAALPVRDRARAARAREIGRLPALARPARPNRQPTARAPSSGKWLTAGAVPSAGARPIGLRRGCGHQPMLPARVCIGVGYWCGVGRPRASRSGAARLGPAALSRARRGTVRVSPCSKAPGALVGASVNSSDPLETEGGGTRGGSLIMSVSKWPRRPCSWSTASAVPTPNTNLRWEPPGETR